MDGTPQDLTSYLGTVSERLALFGSLLQLLEDPKNLDMLGGKSLGEMGAMIQDEAARLEKCREALCPRCQFLEVEEGFQIKRPALILGKRDPQ